MNITFAIPYFLLLSVQAMLVGAVPCCALMVAT